MGEKQSVYRISTEKRDCLERLRHVLEDNISEDANRICVAEEVK
jgi:hypothetical protein